MYVYGCYDSRGGTAAVKVGEFTPETRKAADERLMKEFFCYSLAPGKDYDLAMRAATEMFLFAAEMVSTCDIPLNIDLNNWAFASWEVRDLTGKGPREDGPDTEVVHKLAMIRMRLTATEMAEPWADASGCVHHGPKAQEWLLLEDCKAFGIEPSGPIMQEIRDPDIYTFSGKIGRVDTWVQVTKAEITNWDDDAFGFIII